MQRKDRGERLVFEQSAIEKRHFFVNFRHFYITVNGKKFSTANCKKMAPWIFLQNSDNMGFMLHFQKTLFKP